MPFKHVMQTKQQCRSGRRGGAQRSARCGHGWRLAEARTRAPACGAVAQPAMTRASVWHVKSSCKESKKV